MLTWPFPQTSLASGNLVIERWDAQRDSDRLWHALSAPRVWEFNPRGTPANAHDLADRMGTRAHGPERLTWVVEVDGELVGTTSHFRAGEAVEIGATYLTPSVWGTGLNLRVKRIMVTLARQNDASSLVFRADDLDERANKALLKLGASFTHKSAEKILRADGTRRISRFYRLDNDICL
jgi:RimJ/RimL family protein N-acetyltransferase